MSFKINIKLSGVGETFPVEITLEDTIEDIISKCCEAKTELDKDRVTLVFKGKILKPEQTAESLKLAEDMTIHLVRKPAPKGTKPSKPDATGAATTSAPASSSAPSSTPTTGSASSSTAPNPYAGLGGGSIPGLFSGGGLSGLGGLNMDANTITSMMNNPLFQQMMDNMMSNPEMMNAMIDNNPSLRAMADQNPAIRDMLQNPDLMRSMMTPEAIQASMNLMNNANANSMFGTMSGAPGSMPAPGGASSSSTTGATTSSAGVATGSAGTTSTTGVGASSGATGATGTGSSGKYFIKNDIE